MLLLLLLLLLQTQVLRVDCRDPCHGRLDAARLVHYLSCEIIRTFGMPFKMPDRLGLSSRRVGGPRAVGVVDRRHLILLRCSRFE